MKRNTILIVIDELTNYKNLPKEITDNLKGYQLFKKKCIEFTNIQTSRQQCSPSRSTIISGIYDTGIQDNVEFSYQYNYIDSLPTNIETSGKIYKKNNYDITTYYGKQHLDAKFSTILYSTPVFNTSTTLAMKIYGYDKFNTGGDIYFDLKNGLLTDNTIFSFELPFNTEDYDYIENNSKYSGVIPFLKARLQDKKSYYLEYHIVNPHDTNHYIQNFKKLSSSVMNQFSSPFFFEQINEEKVDNPFYFNEENQYAVPSHPNLLKNYFQDDYLSYKTNKFKLPFLTSYELDYAISPKINSYNPLLVGTYYALKFNMTISESQEDIKSWKNLINNYYGLLFESDSYIERLYYFLEENGFFETTNIILTADHGDQLGAHGLKQKQMPFKECSNVPCLIYSPELSEHLIGKTCDIYGSLTDILPTQIVLNNLNSSVKFDGKSLLVWNNFKLDINYYEHINYIPLNIVNSTMFSLNYFFYLQWYNNNYNGQPLSSNPSNYFEYQSSFYSIIVKINGTKYKFGRYYSIHSIILYNLFIKKEQNNFLKSNFINFIRSCNLLSKKNILTYVIQNFNNTFTFENGLEILSKDFKNSNNFYLYYIYYGFISNTLNTNNNFIYLVPGSLSSWETNEKLNIFSYLLYDLDNDSSESSNLLDPKNFNYVDYNLKNQLNNIINITLEEKNCTTLKTIIADTTIMKLANLMYIIGGFLTSNSKNDIYDILGTLNSTSALDTTLTFNTEKKLQDSIDILTNQINNTNLINPYNIYDSVNNLYYLGEFEYINFIYNTFPYFRNTILSKGLPNLFNLKYLIISNNLFTFTTCFKIITENIIESENF